MIKTVLILSIIFSFVACDYFKDDEENFFDAYKSILVAREKYKNDSLRAEKEIDKIYKKYDYTQQSFKETFFKIAHSDTRKFYDLLDSIRNQVRIDLMKKGKKKPNKDRE
jgi:hypothetical protein